VNCIPGSDYPYVFKAGGCKIARQAGLVLGTGRYSRTNEGQKGKRNKHVDLHSRFADVDVGAPDVHIAGMAMSAQDDVSRSNEEHYPVAQIVRLTCPEYNFPERGISGLVFRILS